MENPETTEEPSMEYTLPETQMTTEAFIEKVNAAGGGTEFVFQPEAFENECHASTIVAMEDGSLVSAWFWGSEEGKSDVGIWISR